jgi:hypothetical protein
VDTGEGKAVPLAPVSLPYSPEFEPRTDPAEGAKTLAEIARITGGVERSTWDDVFNSKRLRDRQIRDLTFALALALLLLHLVEVAGRRLVLFTWKKGDRLQFRPGKRKLESVPEFPEFRSPSPSQPTSPQPTSPPPPPKTASALSRAKAKAKGRMRE